MCEQAIWKERERERNWHWIARLFNQEVTGSLSTTAEVSLTWPSKATDLLKSFSGEQIQLSDYNRKQICRLIFLHFPNPSISLPKVASDCKGASFAYTTNSMDDFSMSALAEQLLTVIVSSHQLLPFSRTMSLFCSYKCVISALAFFFLTWRKFAVCSLKWRSQLWSSVYWNKDICIKQHIWPVFSAHVWFRGFKSVHNLIVYMHPAVWTKQRSSLQYSAYCSSLINITSKEAAKQL